MVQRAYARGEKLMEQPVAPGAYAWYCRGCNCWHHPKLARHFRKGLQLCDRQAYEYDMLEAQLERLKEEL